MSPRRENNHFNKPREFSWLTALATGIATAMLSTSLFLLCTVVQKYGWVSFLLYLTEGDPYPPHIVRKHWEFLQLAAVELERAEKALDIIERDLKFANSPFLNGTVARFLRQTYEHAVLGGDLRRSLSLLINQLDHIVAQLDKVLSAPEIVGWKQELSLRAARLMERAANLLLQPCMKSAP